MHSLSDSQILFYYEIAILTGDDENIRLLKKELVKRGLK